MLLSSNFWSLLLFSDDRYCLSSLPCLPASARPYPLLLIAITYFFRFPFPFVLLSSVVSPVPLAFHPPKVIFCELLQFAIVNLSFSLVKQKGRNPYLSFLLFAHIFIVWEIWRKFLALRGFCCTCLRSKLFQCDEF